MMCLRYDGDRLVPLEVVKYHCHSVAGQWWSNCVVALIRIFTYVSTNLRATEPKTVLHYDNYSYLHCILPVVLNGPGAVTIVTLWPSAPLEFLIKIIIIGRWIWVLIHLCPCIYPQADCIQAVRLHGPWIPSVDPPIFCPQHCAISAKIYIYISLPLNEQNFHLIEGQKLGGKFALWTISSTGIGFRLEKY